ncbi:hypothetical protein NDK43_06905 [Neobacillus pocheonensis]|uniref:DNA-binding protein n=1 Tax=Neobacillus pocheonensis TaxID=363869 RepID=A0ABT0W7X7_9BACI|nr:hypothetical protein [Neobacillus pocheonensis]
MNKLKTSILMTVEILNQAKTKASSLGLSFSAYLEQLVRKDLEQNK